MYLTFLPPKQNPERGRMSAILKQTAGFLFFGPGLPTSKKWSKEEVVV